MSEITDYTDHTIHYYREHQGRLLLHLIASLLTGGFWAFCWIGWLVGSMIRGDWTEEQE